MRLVASCVNIYGKSWWKRLKSLPCMMSEGAHQGVFKCMNGNYLYKNLREKEERERYLFEGGHIIASLQQYSHQCLLSCRLENFHQCDEWQNLYVWNFNYTFCTVEPSIFVHALVFLQYNFCDLFVSEPSPFQSVPLSVKTPPLPVGWLWSSHIKLQRAQW